MAVHPKLKLVVDASVDAKHAVNFVENSTKWGQKKFLTRFLPWELVYVLDKRISEKKRGNLITGYARYFYKNHRREIEKGVRAARADWSKVEKSYFRLVDCVFKGHQWPEGWYVGFATVFHSYPRHIETKTFFFPYSHSVPKYANKVIAHEMLHFMFFDYIEKRYGLKERGRMRGKPSDYIWEVSEVFNNVIEEWKPYKKVFKINARPYKGTERMFAKMNRQWKEKQDVDWLLDQWLRPR
jgi:hypothetical protein